MTGGFLCDITGRICDLIAPLGLILRTRKRESKSGYMKFETLLFFIKHKTF